MRPTALLTASLLLLAATGGAASAERSAADSVRKKGPVVVRDAEAGVHELKVTPPQQADTTTEPSIAVNPEDPLNAVAVYQAGRVDGGCAQTNGYATTFDGGKTWDYGPLPKLTQATGGTTPLASDPVVAFGPDDIVYMNSLMCESSQNDLAVSVSTNGGRTWGKPIRVPTERTFPSDDKNWIVVDNGEGMGHHPGRLYLVWDNIAPVVAMYSDDQAWTWQGPFPIYPDGGQSWSKPLKVNRDVRTDVRFATFSRQSAFLGDYSQIAATGPRTYIVRCEAFRLSSKEEAVFPPPVHHQRTWVAVVDRDGNGKP